MIWKLNNQRDIITKLNRALCYFMAIGLLLIMAVDAGANDIDDLVKATEKATMAWDNSFYALSKRINEPAVAKALIELLSTGSDIQRQGVALGIGDSIPFDAKNISLDPGLIVALGKALENDSNDHVRSMAASSFGRIYNAGYLGTSPLRALKSAAESDAIAAVRRSAVSALGQAAYRNITDHGVYLILIEKLKDPDAEVREATLNALSQFNEAQTSGAVMPLLRDPSPKVRDEAKSLLRRLGVSEELLAQSGTNPRAEFDRLVDKIAQEAPMVTSATIDKKALLSILSQVKPLPPVPDKARQLFSQGLAAFKSARTEKDFESPRDLFLRASNAAPWWPDVYFNLGIVLEKLHQFYDAKEYFELYLLALPDAPDAQVIKDRIAGLDLRDQLWQQSIAHEQRGGEMFNNKDYQAAIREAKEAINKDPENTPAYSLLGGAYIEAGQEKDALPVLKDALARGDREQFTYRMLAKAYYRLNEKDKAIAILQDALQAGNFDSQGATHQRLGYYYQMDGQIEKALEHYQKALDSSSYDQDVDKKYVEQQITVLNRQLGR